MLVGPRLLFGNQIWNVVKGSDLENLGPSMFFDIETWVDILSTSYWKTTICVQTMHHLCEQEAQLILTNQRDAFRGQSSYQT